MKLLAIKWSCIRAMLSRLRGAVSGLFAGWLLMQPPLIQEPGQSDQHKVDLRAPIEQWIQISAHDTAAECERRKVDELKTVIELTRTASGKTDVSKEPLVDAGLRARCVPAEYIYPPKQKVSK